MFVAAIFVLSLLLMWADWVAWRRFLRPMACVGGRRIAGVGLILANLLPYVAVAVMWLDNTSAMVPMMWLLTAYTILSL